MPKLKLLIALSLFNIIMSCGTNLAEPKLGQEELEYLERAKVLINDIRQFPKKGENIEDYFHVFKSVNDLEDANIILFGENHVHSANKLWTAATINQIVKEEDIILFEGEKANKAIPEKDPAERLVLNVLATRKYEILQGHRDYRPGIIGELRNNERHILHKIRNLLAIDELAISKASGKYWDLLIKPGKSHPDSIKRNSAMVDTIKKNYSSNKRVFVVAGAEHIPHYQFARIISGFSPNTRIRLRTYHGYSRRTLGNTFYRFCEDNNKKATTKVIFDFLKGKKFAVLLPKNLPTLDMIEHFLPTNVQ